MHDCADMTIAIGWDIKPPTFLKFLDKILSTLFVAKVLVLTLQAPRKNASENVVCWSRLLQITA